MNLAWWFMCYWLTLNRIIWRKLLWWHQAIQTMAVVFHRSHPLRITYTLQRKQQLCNTFSFHSIDISLMFSSLLPTHKPFVPTVPKPSNSRRDRMHLRLQTESENDKFTLTLLHSGRTEWEIILSPSFSGLLLFHLDLFIFQDGPSLYFIYYTI